MDGLASIPTLLTGLSPLASRHTPSFSCSALSLLFSIHSPLACPHGMTSLYPLACLASPTRPQKSNSTVVYARHVVCQGNTCSALSTSPVMEGFVSEWGSFSEVKFQPPNVIKKEFYSLLTSLKGHEKVSKKHSL